MAAAMRKKTDKKMSDFGSQTVSVRGDFDDAVKKMKAVDRYRKPHDLFIVFESDGRELVETVAPTPGTACSLETLKSVLLECPSRGKVCVALYKFNYPINQQSNTLKSRSILVYGLDRQEMQKARTSSGAMTAMMGFTSNIWIKLKTELSKSGVSPTEEYELSDHNRIAKFSADYVWKYWTNSIGYIRDGEKKSFLAHAEKMIAAAPARSSQPRSKRSRASRSVGRSRSLKKSRSPMSSSAATRSVESSTTSGSPPPAVSRQRSPFGGLRRPWAKKTIASRNTSKSPVSSVDVKEVEAIAKKAAQEEVGGVLLKMADFAQKLVQSWVHKSLDSSGR